MENPYAAYYTTQAGSGISGFPGTRFQRGHGFFGRIFSGILPILRYLGRYALSTGVNVAQDALQGQNLKQSLKRNAADAAANIASDISTRAKQYAQTGSGIKRKRKKRPKTTTMLQRVPAKGAKITKTRKKNKYKKSKKVYNNRIKPIKFFQ